MAIDLALQNYNYSIRCNSHIPMNLAIFTNRLTSGKILLLFPLLFAIIPFFCGCLTHRVPNPSPFRSTSETPSAKTYHEFLSLIEQSEFWMKENFERKEFLIARSPKQEMILHQRVDLRIREQILKRFSEGYLLEQEKDHLLSRCSDLLELWQNQRKRITLKRFQLGLPR